MGSGDPLVGYRIVRIDLCAILGAVRHEALQCLAGRILHHAGGNRARRPVLHTGNGRLAGRAAPGEFLPLGFRHVLPFPAHVGFVRLHGAVKQCDSFVRPCFPDSVQHEPGRFLSDVQIPVQLHAGNALEAGHLKIDRKHPFAQRNLGALKRGADTDRKTLATVRAPIGLLFGVRRMYGFRGAAMRAVATFRPDQRFKPFGCRIFVGKHFRELHQTDAFSVGFAGCLGHDFYPLCLYSQQFLMIYISSRGCSAKYIIPNLFACWTGLCRFRSCKRTGRSKSSDQEVRQSPMTEIFYARGLSSSL